MKELLARMQQDGRLAKPLAKRLDEYQRLGGADAANTYQLEQALPPIRTLIERLSDTDAKRQLLAWYAEQQGRLDGLKDEFRFRFGAALKASLEQHGLTLGGQFPNVRAGFYTIKLDFEVGSAIIFWGPEVERIRGKVRLAAEEIGQAVAGFHARIVKQSPPPEEFVKLLWEAYQRYCHFHRLAPDIRVYLGELMREIAFLVQPKKFLVNPVRDNFQDYSRIQFAYDLFRLRQSEHLTVGGRRLRLSVATFDSTTEKAKSLWVPDNEQGDGTYYSYVSFAEVERTEPDSGDHG